MEDNKDFTFIAVNYYTPNYKKIVDSHLLPSLQQLSIPFYLKEVPDRGRWVKNCQFKAEFILECMKLYPNKHILWLDADAKIYQVPVLFNNIKEDIAVYYLNWKEHYGSKHPNEELISATMYFSNTPKVQVFVEKWAKLCADTCKLEQVTLQELISKTVDISVFKIPREYCYISSLPKGRLPIIPLKTCIIEQFQASRLIKQQLSEVTTKGEKPCEL